MSRRARGRAAPAVLAALWLGLAAAPALAKTVVCPGPVTLHGLDVSYWQLDIDWDKVAATGQKFVIMRAAHALKADTKFAYNWKRCHEVGLRCGVYQYFEPDIDPIAQADLMLKMMGKLKPGDLPPVIDVESKGGATPAQLSAAVDTWIAHVEKAVGRKPMIYTGAYFWEDHVKSTAFVDHPLWHAQYCTSCCPNIANPWKQWKFWQYSSTGKVNGIGGNVDTNRFNGDQKALDALAAVASCTPGCKGSVIVAADCSEGDCGKFGAYCSTAANPKPKCVSAFCAKDAASAPKAGDVCLPDGSRATCSASGDLSAKPCPAKTACVAEAGGAVCAPTSCAAACKGNALVLADCKQVACDALAGYAKGACVADALGPRCVAAGCPAQGTAAICLADPKHLAMGLCQNGAVTVSSCAAGAQVCALTANGVAACAASLCVQDPSKPIAAKASCEGIGALRICDDYGQMTLETCAADAPCQQVGGVAACGGGGAADAGGVDAGGDAGGVADAGGADVGSDAGGDAGGADTGSADTGGADTGSADTGSADAGGGDVGSADGGGAEGIGVDAGANTDADGGAPVSDVNSAGAADVPALAGAAPAAGCGAAPGRAGGPGLFVALLLVAAAGLGLRRRRARS